MTDAEREQLGWGVVRHDWVQFRDNVVEKWGIEDPYAKNELERAAREFLGNDEYAPLDDRVRRVVEVTGRSRTGGEEKNPLTRSSEGGRVTVYKSIHGGLKSNLAAYAHENNLQKWEVLTAVVREYNNGGRAQRLLDVLTLDVVSEVEDGFVNSATTSNDNLSKSDKVEISIAQRLGDQFTETELKNAINDETSGSDYYRNEYAPRVIERKGVVRWVTDDGPDIFVSPESQMKWKAIEIIDELGISEDSPSKPFTRSEFAQAVDAVGIEVSTENKSKVNEYRDRVLNRLDYVWDESAQQFAPRTNIDTTDAEVPADETRSVSDQLDVLANAEPVSGDGEGS